MPYRAPLAWDAAVAHLAARATPGVEAVADVDGAPWYWRTVALDGCAGVVGIGPDAVARDALAVRLTGSLAPVRGAVLARLRRLFDLDMDVPTIEGALARDALLAPLVARRPGLRVLGAFDGFELTLRAILGQQVSVRGATTLAGRLAAAFGERLPPSDSLGGPPLALLPLDAACVADAGAAAVATIGLPRARAECIVGIARAVADGRLPELTGEGARGDARTFAERFVALPGIGPWTASYVAMRALRDADAFPEGDLALRKAAGGMTAAALRARAEGWRPWRAYAAQHLWASLA